MALSIQASNFSILFSHILSWSIGQNNHYHCHNTVLNNAEMQMKNLKMPKNWFKNYISVETLSYRLGISLSQKDSISLFYYVLFSVSLGLFLKFNNKILISKVWRLLSFSYIEGIPDLGLFILCINVVRIF